MLLSSKDERATKNEPYFYSCLRFHIREESVLAFLLWKERERESERGGVGDIVGMDASSRK